MYIIDCKGLVCPQPVINTKKYFDSINEGIAKIIVDNEVAKNNLLKFASNNGYEGSFERENGLFKIIISKNMREKDIMNKTEELSIIISSDKLGNGDDVLGNTLMKTYVYALSESDVLPKNLIFINGGVKLTIEGSIILGSLNILKNRGVNILSCGTCLDFYDIKEKLAVGEITNMYTIVEIMNTSKNTIKI
ncbi:hypothetical protein CPJCM30710_22890 [Clostridium polyendosporum]|uniref:UPF0033 domain-containing protein n=1 Tax=Clostridium polyendosporum TaxID=69208 RepID=A0A919S1N4_9CLOT|nr:sulfurtransferase-like selenium metabolism protein YedF [Clostridium polyendosporum]GIM29623.1 hypothetical protein CPJCM30710_22890 [Clostridium polyendosporum]